MRGELQVPRLPSVQPGSTKCVDRALVPKLTSGQAGLPLPVAPRLRHARRSLDPAHDPSTATSAGSVVTFGGATGCASFAFGMAGAVAPACGNLVATSIPDATNTVTIFLCADGTTNCSLSGTTTVQTPSGTVTSSVVTPIANADGSATYDVPGVGAVAVSPGGTPAIVASPSATTTPSADTSSSDGGGGAGGGMMLYIIIAAVVVVLAVVAVVVVKKKGGGGGSAPQDKHAAMGFENPLYDDTTSEHGSITNPTFDGDDAEMDGNYMDLPEADVGDGEAATTGYMDVDHNNDNGGYLDVDVNDVDSDEDGEDDDGDLEDDYDDAEY
eukprot:m.243452 g.243452  ORF g.243452 m.243452 type:complete len:327 (+) comp26360_c1_seq1:2377-3357(+)